MNEIALFRERVLAMAKATSAETDEQLLQSWLDSLHSPHTRRNFEMTGRAFLAGLTQGLRGSTIEDVRHSLNLLSHGLKDSTTRQYVLRAKSLMTYAHELGYMPFNAGTTIKVRGDGNRGAALAKRIVTETEVALLIRFTTTPRDRVLVQMLYAGGLRISEATGLIWGDCIERDELLQINVTGKGGKVRNILLPKEVSATVRSLRGDAKLDAPMFAGRSGARLTERTINYMLKQCARRAGVTDRLSPHWLRHAHGSHALDNGATLAEVQETLGHGNVATTSGYLHARPNSSSGLKLDPGIFRNKS